MLLFEEFKKVLKDQKNVNNLRTEIQLIKNESYKIDLATEWVASFVKSSYKKSEDYIYEIVCLFLYEDTSAQNIVNIEAEAIIKDLLGSHASIKNQEFIFWGIQVFIGSGALFAIFCHFAPLSKS